MLGELKVPIQQLHSSSLSGAFSELIVRISRIRRPGIESSAPG